jgi:outer membrane receptor protein involved in Fe transport
MLQKTIGYRHEPAFIFTINTMFAAVIAAFGAPCAQAQDATQLAAAATLPEVSVTGTREKELLSETPASIGVIKEEAIRQVRPTHPSQIISQVPGAAVAITNGEGHQTAIRQPFTTGPVYLFLEDGIPIRATGFFNHNALYEINIPGAGGIEVIRGPGTALYGSDAIGGVVNVLTPAPPTRPEGMATGEVGSNGWRRLLLGGGTGSADSAWRADANITHTDGWRDKTAYDRQSLGLRWDYAIDGGQTLKTIVSLSRIDQETGANSPLTYTDYLFNPKNNYLPIAYRKVEALRISTNYERESGNSLLSITPYFRDNSMDLLASFTLNSDPTVYNTQNQSFGVIAKWRQDFPQLMRARLIAGVDVDVSPGGRREDRLNLTTSGAGASRYALAYTINRRVYDYDVTYKGVSPYLHGEISPTERLRLTGGLRYDALSYDFTNNFAAGTVSSGAGVFYGQAANTTADFKHLSPKLGVTFALSDKTSLYTGYNHGFRAPSEGQLFRPSVSTTAALALAARDAALRLKPIKADQVELGVRGEVAGASYNLVVYNLIKRDDIVGFTNITTNVRSNVNAGRTSHRGIELGVGAPLSERLRLDIAYSYAKHKYEEWITSTTTNLNGFEMESAPRLLGNSRLTWTPLPAVTAQLEWVQIGRYWVDAGHTKPQYSGHDLFNLRASWAVAKQTVLFAKVDNLQNRRFADSASVTSNTAVFSPGLPRTFFAGAELKW